MTRIDKLAEYVSGLSFDRIPEAVTEKAELHIFDSLSLMLAGLSGEETRATLDLIQRLQTIGGGFPVPGLNISLPLPASALLAVTAARMTETDDIHLDSCTTPGSVIVPTAILTARFAKADGRTVLEGVVAGYDVMTRLGAAVKGFETVYRGVWPTYLCAPLCVAAVASKILGLPLDQIRHALAVAVTMSSGLSGKIWKGMTTRWLTLGSAVQSGLLAALSAEKGFAGDLTILETIFQSAYGINLDENLLVDGLGEHFNISRMSLKPYCTARQALSSVEAFRWIIGNHRLDPESIESIEIQVPEQYIRMIDKPDFPESRDHSLVSIQYQMALAAYHEEGLFDIHRRMFQDNLQVRRFMEKIRLIPSRELTALYPRKWTGKVSLSAAGTTYDHEVISPLGDPDHPMTWEQVKHKSTQIHRGVLIPEQIERLGAAVKSLRHAKSIDVLANQMPIVG